MDARLRVIADRQGGVFSRRQALSSGFSGDQILRCLKDDRWVRIRHGQYAEKVDLSALPAWERIRWSHRQQIHAVMNSLRSGSVAVSHQSSLVLQDLPTWGLGLDRVHVSRLDGLAGGVVAGVQHHVGTLTRDDLIVASGRLATGAVRAAVETACTAPFEQAVVCIDAALRAEDASEDDVRRLLELVEFWPGGRTARAALRFGTKLAESVGESRLRVFLHDHGFPEPDLQVEFYDRHGLIGRVDFYFPAYNLVVEFDGRLKYGGGSSEVLIREKRREDRLRALGLGMVRTDWTDFDRPVQLATTLRQAFAQAATAV